MAWPAARLIPAWVRPTSHILACVDNRACTVRPTALLRILDRTVVHEAALLGIAMTTTIAPTGVVTESIAIATTPVHLVAPDAKTVRMISPSRLVNQTTSQRAIEWPAGLSLNKRE